MQRISVVGTSGAGKTTLARQLAQPLAIPHVELDALYWEPNWTEAANEVFRERVTQALQHDRWVVDGNYSKVRDLIWGQADTVVWLDYPLRVILGQLLQRSLYRSLTGQELWSGNRETLQKTFLSRDSILLWALQTYTRRRKEYPRLFRQPEYAHLQVVHLHSRTATREFLQTVS